jgi:hypothetical protein
VFAAGVSVACPEPFAGAVRVVCVTATGGPVLRWTFECLVPSKRTGMITTSNCVRGRLSLVRISRTGNGPAVLTLHDVIRSYLCAELGQPGTRATSAALLDAPGHHPAHRPEARRRVRRPGVVGTCRPTNGSSGTTWPTTSRRPTPRIRRERSCRCCCNDSKTTPPGTTRYHACGSRWPASPSQPLAWGSARPPSALSTAGSWTRTSHQARGDSSSNPSLSRCSRAKRDSTRADSATPC